MFVGLLGNRQIVSPARADGGQTASADANRPSDQPPDALASAFPSDALRTHKPSSMHTARLSSQRQLPTVILAPDDLDLENASSPNIVCSDVPGRRIPAVIQVSGLARSDLVNQAVPLPEANMLGHVNYHDRRFVRLQTAEGERLLFNPQSILVKFKDQARVSAISVEAGRELEAARAIADRPDVEFAELDILQRQAFDPNDPLIGYQWHHQKIGSFAAWDKSLGQSLIRIAIVDPPFQMDPPAGTCGMAGAESILALPPLPPRQPCRCSPGPSNPTANSASPPASSRAWTIPCGEPQHCPALSGHKFPTRYCPQTMSGFS